MQCIVVIRPFQIIFVSALYAKRQTTICIFRILSFRKQFQLVDILDDAGTKWITVESIILFVSNILNAVYTFLTSLLPTLTKFRASPHHC